MSRRRKLQLTDLGRLQRYEEFSKLMNTIEVGLNTHQRLEIEEPTEGDSFQVVSIFLDGELLVKAEGRRAENG